MENTPDHELDEAGLYETIKTIQEEHQDAIDAAGSIRYDRLSSLATVKYNGDVINMLFRFLPKIEAHTHRDKSTQMLEIELPFQPSIGANLTDFVSTLSIGAKASGEVLQGNFHGVSFEVHPDTEPMTVMEAVQESLRQK